MEQEFLYSLKTSDLIHIPLEIEPAQESKSMQDVAPNHIRNSQQCFENRSNAIHSPAASVISQENEIGRDDVTQSHFDCETKDKTWHPQRQISSTGMRRLCLQLDSKKCQGDGNAKRFKITQEQYASLSAKLSILQQQVQVNSLMLLERDKRKPWDPVQVLKRSLRNRLLVYLQKPCRNPLSTLKNPKTCVMNNETTSLRGTTTLVLKTSCECTLETFEALAMNIFTNERSKIGNRVSFFPPYHYTQNPAAESTSFDIVFDGLGALCDTLDINAVVDRLGMLVRKSNSPKGKLMRILGAYLFDELRSDVNAIFFPGASCGGQCKDLNVSIQDQSGDRSRSKPALLRATREFLDTEERFACPLHLVRMMPSRNVDPSSDQFEMAEKRQFLISWKRSDEPSRRMWSNSVCFSEQVNGRIELSLPCVVSVGEIMEKEIDAIFSEEIRLEAIQ